MITGSGIRARFRDYAVAIIENEVTKPPAAHCLLTATLHKDTSINLALHSTYPRGVRECTRCIHV